MRFKYLLIPVLFFTLTIFVTGCSTLDVLNISDVKALLMNDRELEKEVAGVNLEILNKEYNLKSPRKNSQYVKALHKLETKNPTSLDYKIHISNSKAVNALYIGNGNIVLFKGLLQKLNREDQVAAVIAHEMGHGINKHIVKNIRSNIGSKVVKEALHEAGVGVNIRNFGMYFLKNGFSRGQEEEADIESLKLLKKANYNPGAAIQVMEKLDKMNASDLKLLEIFQTHPLPKTRINYMSKYLRKH